MQKTDNERLKIKVVGINARYTHSCLALFYLRNELEKRIENVAVEICQYTINDPYYILVQRLSEGFPDYFFFSSAIWNSDLISSLVHDLLLIDESFRCVIGGPQSEVIGEQFVYTDRVTVYSGSIEGADPGFYADIRADAPQKYYRTSFFKSAILHFDYPYRFEDFGGPLENRHIYYESSRGCPFSCTYCLSSSEKGLYHKPLDRVVAELEDMLTYRPSVVRFIDRTFNDIPDRALAIWNFLIEHGGETLFHFEIAPDRFTGEMFEVLENVKPHRFQFEIGIQSTNNKTLKAIQRPIDPQVAALVIKKIRSLETIHIHADLILGLPYETENTFLCSLDDIFAMRPHYIQMGLLKLLPHTQIHKEADHHEYRASRRPPYGVYANRWIDSGCFRNLYWLSECVEKFVNNRYFISIWSYFADHGEKMSLFFSSLSRRLLADGYFWKAATQERLSILLLHHLEDRDDSRILKELLCYDWLRCGHRFLPDHLRTMGPEVDEFRRGLFRYLPETLEGYYDRSTRVYFFKKSVFFLFSRESLTHMGYEVTTDRGIVRFSSEREDTVLRLHRTQLLPGLELRALSISDE